jgi:HEAT repeat protein
MDPKAKVQLEQAYQATMRLADYHCDQSKIVDGFNDTIVSVSSEAAESTQVTSSSANVHQEADEGIDQLISRFLYENDESPDSREFTNSFSRLLKTGQQGKAIQIIDQLMDMLEASEPKYRQNALAMIENALETFDIVSDTAICNTFIDRVTDRLQNKSETYEYSEIIWRLIEKGITSRNYDVAARLTKSMSTRRRFLDSVTIYDSMAVKHAYSNINRPEIISALIDDMVKSGHDTAVSIQDILIAVSTEEVALALANIISHPVRQVRQQTLKILAELGKASLKVFARIMADDSMFERESDRHELPDARWYVVRNTIFVLGSLKDTGGVAALRLRINDKDIRVRREVVRSLEKIGGEDACDLLIVMADDRDREISESAIIAAGIIGRSESAPLFIDVARRHPSLSARCIYALGKLGGDETRDYLIKLLGCEDELIRLTGEGLSKDDLRLAAIKALGNIGGDEAIKSIQQYNDNMSRTQKLFLKNSPVNKAIKEVLG